MTARRHALGLLAAALAAPACGNAPATGDGGVSPLDVVAGWSGSPVMDPGLDCLTCHSAGSSTSCSTSPCRAAWRPWSLAGTVYGSPDAGTADGVAGVQVVVTDSTGKTLTLVSNAAGNFYTAEPLSFPLASLMVQNGKHRMAMNLDPSIAMPPQIGSCNLCHTQPPAFTAPGRLFVPGD